MRRARAVTINAMVYRGEGDTETEIEVEVYGSVEPYWAGNFHNPPEGGYAEDVRAIFYDGKKQYEIQLTDKEEQEFQDALLLANDEYEYDGPDDEPDYDD